MVKIGRYGPLVQMGSADNETKPRFASLQRGQSIEKTIPIPADAIAADGTAKLVFSGANGKASPQITKIRVMRKAAPSLR